jgi:hypothetical protein
MKKTTITILAFLFLSSLAHAKQIGHWETITLKGENFSFFVKHELSNIYDANGFTGVNLLQQQGVLGDSTILKKAHLSTIPYYQKQIDNYGKPRGEGKWANYGTMGMFGIAKPN